MGKIVRVSGPVVIAEDLENARMYDVVRVGDLELVGEIIKISGGKVTVQVYEDTSGIRPGEKIETTGRPLSVELGPGLLKSIYDGIQRPLDVIREQTGDFIRRGYTAPPLDEEKKWHFTAKAKPGDEVKEGQIIGEVQETGIITHKVMVPFGKFGKIKAIKDGDYTLSEVFGTLVEDSGNEVPLKLKQEWPVRTARRVLRKFPPETPLITGQRVIDTFFPVAKGGTVAVPGPFGSGKCVTGDTPVQMGDGSIVNMEELYTRFSSVGTKIVDGNEEYIRLPKPVELMSFYEGKLKKSNSSLLYKGKSDSVVRVRTRTGREVRVTPVHKLFKLEGRGEIVETMAKDLSVGDYIVSAKNTGIETADAQIDLYSLDSARVLDSDIRQEVAGLLKKSYSGNVKIDLPSVIKHSLSRSSSSATPKLSWIKEIYTKMGKELPRPKMLVGDSISTPVRIPERVNSELAEFLGYYASEGYVRGEETVVFTNSEEELLDRFIMLASRLFGITGKKEYQSGKTPNVLLHSKIVTNFLDVLGAGRNSSTKKIPDVILRSSNASLSAFLTSYFIGDGTFGVNEIEFSTASRTLATQLSYVLTRFGIMNTQSIRKINNVEYQRLYVRGLANARRFLAILESDHRKVAKIADYVNSGRSTYDSVDIVPISSEYTGELYRKYTRYSDLLAEGIEISNYIGNGEHMGAVTFRKFESSINGTSGQIQETVINDLAKSLDYVYFDRIVKLEEEAGPFDVYDVSVPEYGKNFIGGYGGIILHNTVVQHQLSKWADSDIVVYVGCGERGNEMTEILTTFPELEDPRSGRPLMERTVLIANTSNMPVPAREAGIYTGITIAEYYRDMGYDVALMADSTSRWAEALREISGRLEEMPGEEGYPAYLGRRLSEFYERSGNALVVSEGERQGSITIVGAVSPPGGDISEPVSQNTLRVTRVFWALDASLASRRHFPSINWLNSYSLYQDTLKEWYSNNVTKEWGELYSEAMGILQKESELQEVVQLVGYDALPEKEKAVLDVARMIREDFLQQSAFDEVDTYCSMKKQHLMLDSILKLGRKQSESVDKGLSMGAIQTLQVRQKISRMKEIKDDNFEDYYNEMLSDIKTQFSSLLEVQ